MRGQISETFGTIDREPRNREKNKKFRFQFFFLDTEAYKLFETIGAVSRTSNSKIHPNNLKKSPKNQRFPPKQAAKKTKLC